MFKRISVLVRRPDHDRATFSRLWERHAAPVSGLPRLRGYIQNHVEAEFGAAPIAADGFVELLWDRPEDMAVAFAGEAARPMVEDEPGFLGHGSGYAIRQATPLREATGGKLIVVGGVPTFDDLPGLSQALRDDVVTLIPKPGMAPPQPVGAFHHLWFVNVAAAEAAGRAIAEAQPAAGVWRVRTLRFA